jgi:hypothetical protein
MIVLRQARATFCAVELKHGDTLRFRRLDGAVVSIDVVDSGAAITRTTLATPGVEEPGATTVYRFWADLVVDGQPHRLEREVGTQASFYEPWLIAGLHLWLDAVDAVFTFMHETHGPCRLQADPMPGQSPRRQVRLALQDANARLCPEPLQPWCPLPPDCLRIEDCYRGEDCWLGAYDGASAHGGLDINHPVGTPLHAPIALDTQFLYNSVALGRENNRWRGLRHWPDHSTWILTTCHMVDLTVPEHTPLAAGQHYAHGAGTWIGAHPHSHFSFAVLDHAELIHLDPWLLFWQTYRDRS